MGTWSVALYGSDVALDLRDQLRELLRTPFDEQAILETLGTSFPGLHNKDDEEYPDVWLVLADQFHRHAVPAPQVFATVAAIIETGLDLAAKRALGMTERDLAKRAKVLNELRTRWAMPHPKPVARRIQLRPDALTFDIGDCVCYPVKDTGKTINPYFPTPEADPDWRHDGYGAMAVLGRGHYLGTFAWYAIARLSLFGREKPTLDVCAAARIEAQTTTLAERMGERPQLCVFAGRLTPLQARKMRFEVVGRLVPNDAHIREDAAAFFAPGFVPGVCLANELSGFGVRDASSIALSRYLQAGPG